MHTINKVASRLLLAVASLLIMSASASAWAESKKFVYVYDVSGKLLKPSNAAANCADPDGSNNASTDCRGVAVDASGNYSVRLAKKDVPKNANMILVLCEFDYLPANSGNAGRDSYALLKRTRRVDAISAQTVNNGSDINALSEAVAKGLEKIHNLPNDDKGFVSTSFAALAAQVDADELNQAMGNGKHDNAPDSSLAQHERDLLAANQDRFTRADEAQLAALASVVVDNHSDSNLKNYVRKNVLQSLFAPTLLPESADRVFSHVARVHASDSNAALMILDADKYRVSINETATLSTARSVNPGRFFAYTWNGVDSDRSSAELNKPTTGSYLVCASGEISGASDSSTDCVRILVKDPINAVARAASYRVAVNSIVRLSGAASVGATRYMWSGSGFFSDVAAQETAWKAPAVVGTYPLKLTVDSEDSDIISIEVYDVLPIALAKSSADNLVLSGGNASFTLTSISTTTDGSAVDTLAWSIISQPGGAAPGIVNSSAVSANFNTNKAGNYVVQLSASKGTHTDTTELTLQVRQAGALSANAGADQTTFRNVAALLDGSRSRTLSGKNLAYLWTSESGTLGNANAAKATFTAGIAGSYSARLTVSDGDSQASDDVTVDVRNRAPVASDDTFKMRPGKILTGQLRTRDEDGDHVDYSLVSEPRNGGVALDQPTGRFVYIPGGTKACHYQTDTIDLGSYNDVPVLKLCADRYIVAPGDTVNLMVSASINAAKFSGYSWKNATPDPSDIRHASFVSTNEGTFQVCVTGNVGQSKNISTACIDIIVGANPGTGPNDGKTSYTDRFKFKGNDGSHDSNIATATIVVTWENLPPNAQALALTTPEETSLNGVFSATDEEGQALSYTLARNGSRGTAVVTNAATGAFTYTPNKDVVGTDTFTYVANDGYVDSNSATVTVTITNVNDAPVARFSGSLSVIEDIPKSGQLAGSDIDGDALSFHLIAQATLGDVVITNANTGEFVYTPKPNATGNDSFYFSSYDGALESTPLRVPVVITNVNDTPTANDMGPLSLHSDEASTIKLAGLDVDGDALLYSIVTQPKRGKLTLTANTGNVVYTPNGAADLGADNFTYRVNDATSTSNTASVSLTVLAVNHAPIGNAQRISVFEGVAYGGVLTGSDSDANPLTFSIVANGKLGTAEISNAKTGVFVYTPKSGVSGDDYFTFKVGDGDKESAAITVNATITALGTLCLGPNSGKDTDADGWADFVEIAFGTNINSAASTPYGMDGKALGIAFSDDHDSDGYSDLVELWLKSDPRSAGSVPTASTLKGLPDCFNSGRDTATPHLQAFQIVTPTVDASAGSAVAKFALTVIDNAAGINQVIVRIKSPTGIEHKAMLSPSDKPLVLAAQLSTATFSLYAEAGLWTVTELKITDASGQSLTLTTDDLKARGLPTTLTVGNNNADSSAPTASNFEILTPTLDVSSASAPATFRLTLADNRSGIKRVAVALRSPSGVFRWGEVIRSDDLTSVTQTLSSQPLESFVEPGTWTISAVSVIDSAGNPLKFNTAALSARGWPSTLQVITSKPDTAAPTATSFSILTTSIDPTPGNISAVYSVALSDNDSGISDVVVVLTGPSSEMLLGNYHSSNPIKSLSTSISSEAFNSKAQAGVWTIYALMAADAAGNVTYWSTQDLTSLGYGVTLTVKAAGGGNTGGKRNIAPVAVSSSISTNEDQTVSGTLRGSDADGDALLFTLVAQPAHGRVKLIDAAAGTFSYTPNTDFNGTDSYTFMVDDGKVTSNIAAVSVEVIAAADPSLVEDSTITVTTGQSVIDYLHATDADGETLVYTIASNGAQGTATLINSTGTFQYTPKAGALGGDQFTFTAHDSNSTSRIGTVSVQILPLIGLDNFEVRTPVVSANDANVLLTAAVTLSRPTTDISEVRVTLKGPSGQSIGFATAVSGSAYPIFTSKSITTATTPLEPGLWTFVDLLVKRKAGGGLSEVVASNIAAMGFAANVTVLANTSPVANGANYTTTLDMSKSGSLAAVDANGDALTYRISRQPSKGEVTLGNAATGAFVYTPHALGADNFQFTVSDGKTDSLAATVSFTVIANNGVPVAYSASAAVTKNIVYAGTLITADANGDALTYSVVGAPALGTVVLSNASTGAYVYYPNANATGVDTFTFKVNDGTADSNIATLSISINASNVAPIAVNDDVTVFKNVSFSGTLVGNDAEGSTLTYSVVGQPNLGSVSVNAGSGAFIYTPAAHIVGNDAFTFKVNDGTSTSNTATVNVHIVSTEQACGSGGLILADSDGDGYADDVERAFGSDPNLASSVPADINNTAASVLFKGDTDNDSVEDHIESWLHTDMFVRTSTPKTLLRDCFAAGSDGIKPRLLAFNLPTANVDIGTNQITASYVMTLADNASGVKRVRISLSSPSGQFVTHAHSFSDHPLLRSLRLDVAAFNGYSEAGLWTISGITIFDEAGNRLDLTNADLVSANLPNAITVTNSSSDATAPSLTSFALRTPNVDPSSGTAKFSTQVTLSDSGSGVASVRVDFISASGTLVSAVSAISNHPASATVQVDTPILSSYLEQGTWTVFGVLLVDNAGNSTQLASQLVTLGYSNTLLVSNASSDAIAPILTSFAVLTPNLYVSAGGARMSIAVSAADNASGIEKIRVDVRGPSNQLLTLWGDYAGQHPVSVNAQINSAVLSTLSESGNWSVENVAIYDNAGNYSLYSTDDLSTRGLATRIVIAP